MRAPDRIPKICAMAAHRLADEDTDQFAAIKEPGRSMWSINVFIAVMVAGLLVVLPFNGWINGNEKIATAATIFAGIFVQAVPFLVLGTLVSGAIAAWVTPAVVARILPRRTSAAIGVSGLAGALLPGCECASVPVSARLMDRGVPQAAALAFLLSAPAINPVVLVSTAVAFPGEPMMVAARFGASLATALVVAALWDRFGDPTLIARRAGRHAAPDNERGGWPVFTQSMREDFLVSAAYLALGACAVALLRVVVPAAVFETFTGQIVLGIVAMAVLAVVLAVCSEADAFVAAGLSMMPRLGQLVFMVVGPAVDIKLFAMQSGVFGSRFAVRFAAVTFVVAVGCAVAVGAATIGWR